MRYVCLFVISPLLFILPPAHAEMVNFTAQIECDDCRSYAAFSIELSDSSKNHSSSASVGLNGSAYFQGLPEGSYMVTVKDFHGNPVHQEVVTVRPHCGPLSIRLREPKTEKPVSGLVSVARLKHKVPKQARKAFVKSVQLNEKGDNEASLEYLKKATEIDPEYMEAFNNLGARYMNLGQHASALSAFRRAMELDPSSTMVQVNASAALVALGQLKEAETTLRRVVENTGNVKAKYMLGLTLFSQKQYTEEALDLFRRSAEEFPNTRLPMAVIHASRGQTKEARQVLKSYLPIAPESGRAQAKALLAGLQRQGE